MADDIEINEQLTIPAAELEITASRSSGPGGQHVNKADTRIQVRWSVTESQVLSRTQRERLQRKLAARLTEAGELLIACETHRSQHRNREEALLRLADMVREALVPPKPRKKTRPPRAAKEKRLQEKKHRGEIKKGRGKLRGPE